MKKNWGLFFLVFISIAFAVTVNAVDINYNLPGSQITSSANNPCTTVINVYYFALFISGVLAFGAIVYGGIRYAISAGNPSGQSEGIDWIKGALYGILLLASAYFLLNIINPTLVNCAMPQLSSLPVVTVPPGNGSGNPSSRCEPPASGPCSTAILQASGGTCFGNSINTAAGVCNVESSNQQNALSGTDKAADGSPASVGLFQINISANKIGGLNCPSAFQFPITGTTIKKGIAPAITDRTLYNQCVAAAQNIKNNVAAACTISSNGSSYGRWGPSTLIACGI